MSDLATQVYPWRAFLHENVQPRFSCRSGREIVPEDEEQFRRLTDPAFDPGKTILLFEPAGEPARSNRPEESSRVLSFSRETNEVRLAVRVAEPSLLLLSQTWYPGWRAFVDGRRAEILRADYGLTAVRLPAGSRGVHLGFSPWRQFDRVLPEGASTGF